MRRTAILILTILLLSGCTATPADTSAPPPETTIPAESTLPPVTTAPTETTMPPVTTVPAESTAPLDPAEAEIRTVVEAFLTAYEENCYLYTDHEYDHLTVLDADADATVSYDGKSVSLSEFHDHIQSIHDEEEYWKEARQQQGIHRHDFESACYFHSISYDGDTATVSVAFAMSFTYDDRPGTTSGGGDDFEVLLVHVDGRWLVADLKTIGA